MANFYGTRRNGYRLKLVLNQGSQSIADNASLVPYELHIENDNTATFSSGSKGNLNVNGASRWSIGNTTIALLKFNSSTLLKSGNLSVTHNSDGTKTVSGNATFQTNNQSQAWSVPPLTVSGSLTLDPIYRTVWVKDGSTWKRAIPWVKDGSTWKRSVAWVKDGSTWRRSGG